ncbi:alpha/beta hydrolase-fold protein [Paracoccus sp. MBLB3053]|uniref:Alpha/beta hydrolase-fold protein n=1 Tax=Paracoccus aurantius TaxID=3073814 RepID=A0ABU2HUW6_9RHOB|nr:alpha/beta hydrolase-fold protein [Paracoccus sp. MBLB3053]MDS9468837.1 alpha/beta hydrolase-fold protein [Paracoccus sp. MBLB3053]
MTTLPPRAGRRAELAILAHPPRSHRIEIRDIEADAAPEAGGPETYRLFIARPVQTRAAGHPVLYMLDGNAAFDFLSAPLLEAHPWLMVVGVGYATGQQFARASRIRDYSPPEAPGGALQPDPHHPDRLAGGAGQFLARLIGPLRLAAESGVRIDPRRRTLWGHSFGGLFSLFAAATAPESFARYAMVSPSIWWNEDLAHRLVARAGFAQATPIYFAVGDREKRGNDPGPEPTAPPAATIALRNALARRPGVDLRAQVFPGAIHIASLPASLPRTLDLAGQD